MVRSLSRRTAEILAAALAIAGTAQTARAEDDRIARLERIILEQQKKMAEQERRLKELEGKREAAPAPGPRLPRIVRRPTSSPTEESPATPRVFYANTRKLFEEIGEDGLSRYRAGSLSPMVRVMLPDGSSVVMSAASIGEFLAQAKEPDFTTEPERPRQDERQPPPRRAAPPPRRPVVRTQPPPPPPATTPPPPATDESERAKSRAVQDQALLERGAILLRPGALQIEPSIEYNKFGGNSVQISGVSIFDAILIGIIRVDANDVDLITGNMRVRYGVINRLQVDANVPYVYRHDREILGIGTPNVQERSTSNHRIGDIELGVSGQPIIGRGWIPNVLLRANVKIPTGESGFEIPTVQIPQTNERRLIRPPTGSGFWAAGLTATAVWSIDPVVLFAGGGYTMNFARNWGGFGRVDPGDTIQFFAGLNFALNERVSFNFSFIDQQTFFTKRDHEKVLNTQATDARAIFGTSIGLTRNINLTANVGIGLTTSSPRFSFLAALPITFQIFE